MHSCLHLACRLDGIWLTREVRTETANSLPRTHGAAFTATSVARRESVRGRSGGIAKQEVPSNDRLAVATHAVGRCHRSEASA